MMNEGNRRSGEFDRIMNDHNRAMADIDAKHDRNIAKIDRDYKNEKAERDRLTLKSNKIVGNIVVRLT